MRAHLVADSRITTVANHWGFGLFDRAGGFESVDGWRDGQAGIGTQVAPSRLVPGRTGQALTLIMNDGQQRAVSRPPRPMPAGIVGRKLAAEAWIKYSGGGTATNLNFYITLFVDGSPINVVTVAMSNVPTGQWFWVGGEYLAPVPSGSTMVARCNTGPASSTAATCLVDSIEMVAY